EKLMISEVADTLSKWRDQLSGDDLLRLLGAVGTMEAAWTTIGVDNVARVKTLLTTKSASQYIEHREFASGAPYCATLVETYDAALMSLKIEQLIILVPRIYPKSQWIAPTLREVKKVVYWRSGERSMSIATNLAGHMILHDIQVTCVEFLTNSQL